MMARTPGCDAMKALTALIIASASLAAVSQGAATGATPIARGSLFLVAANLEQQYDASDPVPIYRVSADRQLLPEVTVLDAQRREGKSPGWNPVGVYSVHEVGSYLLVEYPRLNPMAVVFVPKENPRALQTIKFDPEGYPPETLFHELMDGPGGLVCDLWPLTAVSAVLDEKGYVSVGKAILRSACKQPGGPPFLKTDDWTSYKNLRLDGLISPSEYSGLSSQGGKLIARFVGGPSIELGNMPQGFGAKTRSGPRINPKDCFTDFGSSVCPDGRGVTLEAASSRYLIGSMSDDKAQDHNEDVFVRASNDGAWVRLPVPAVAPAANDRLRYRLFDDWLVTSLSASLAASIRNKIDLIAEVLTVSTEGTEPALAPGTSTFPSRTLTLYNLADSRRIAIAIPEDDSEIVHVFDGHTVLLRIKDKLFSAEIEGSKLANYKLVAFDSAIPQVHWAFYSNAQ